MPEQIYCNERTDGYKIHELVEEVDYKYGKILYRCKWCEEYFND